MLSDFHHRHLHAVGIKENQLSKNKINQTKAVKNIIIMYTQVEL